MSALPAVSVLEAGLIGHTEPRVGTPMSGDDRRGREIVGFAADLGIDLLPWQRELFRRSLAMTGDRWTHRTILAITARQNAKTTSAAVRALAELCLWDGKLVIACAQSRDVALHTFRFIVNLAEEAGLHIVNVRRAAGSEELVLAEGSFKVVSSTAAGPRGLSPDLVLCDEIQALKTHEPFGALEKARRARPNSQCWCIATEGDFSSVVLDRLAEQGRAAAAEGVVGPLGYYEWSAAPDRAPDDREGWRESNPALGYLITEDTIAAELLTDEPSNFEREVLCRRTTVTRSWLPAGAWDRCADPTATVPDSAVGEVVFGLDACPDLSRVAIAVAWRRPDGRVHVELIATFDSTWAAEEALRGLVTRWQPRCLALVGKGPAEPVGARLGADGVELQALSGADLDRAARSFYEAASSARVVHPLDPVLAAHVEAVQGQGGLLSLKSTPVGLDVAGAVAAVVACWAVERTPVVTVPSWVAF